VELASLATPAPVAAKCFMWHPIYLWQMVKGARYMEFYPEGFLFTFGECERKKQVIATRSNIGSGLLNTQLLAKKCPV
jgi:hypothetical protein